MEIEPFLSPVIISCVDLDHVMDVIYECPINRCIRLLGLSSLSFTNISTAPSLHPTNIYPKIKSTVIAVIFDLLALIKT